MDKKWMIVNLQEAHSELERAIAEIKGMSEDEEFLAQQILGEVYIKLNYAWNSREMKGLESNDRYHEMIQYPKEMDIYSGN